MRHVIQSLLFALVFAAPCLAQAEPEPEEPKSYVMPYFVVGGGIALGLVAICRPGKRSKTVRAPE